MSNIVTMFVFGERYPFDDPRKTLLDETFARYMEAMEKGNWIDIVPGIFKNIAAFLPFARQGTLHNFGETATNFMRCVYTLTYFSSFYLYTSKPYPI